MDTNTTWSHNANIDTDKPVTVTNNSTLTIAKGAGDVVKGTVINMGDITLEAGSKLYLDANNNLRDLTNKTANKVTFASPITMKDGTTLETKDGSWYMKGGLTVDGDATVIHNWGKGIIYNAINGSGTLRFQPVNNDPKNDIYTQTVYFSAAGNFNGTVELGKATGENGAETRYVVANRGAFQKADVELLGGPMLDFSVTNATFRKLGGDATLTGANSGTTLKLLEDSTFSGTVGNKMTLTSGAGSTPITITLDGATVASGAKVAGSSTADDLIRLVDTTIAHGGQVTGSNIDITGVLTLDFQGNTTLGSDTPFLQATGALNLDRFMGLHVANYQQLDFGTYTVLETSDSSYLSTITDNLATLTGANNKSFFWMTNENSLQLKVVDVYQRFVQDTVLPSTFQNPIGSTIFIGGEGLAATLTIGEDTVPYRHEATVGDFQVESGSTLHFNILHEDAPSSLNPDMDGKVVLETAFALEEGSTLELTGSYFFIDVASGVRVMGDATIISHGDGNVVFTLITGTGDPEIDKDITLTFDPGELAEGDDSTKLTTISPSSIYSFAGTLEFNNRYTVDEDGNRDYSASNDRYFIDILDPLGERDPEINDFMSTSNVHLGENVKLGYNGGLLNIGGLSGDSTSGVYSVDDEAFWEGTEGMDIVSKEGGYLYIAITGDFDSTFSGTIGTEDCPLDLEINNRGSQTLDGATINGWVYVEDGEITLHNMEEMDFETLNVSGDSTVNFGKGEYTLDSAAMNILGYVNVLEDSVVTVTDYLIDAKLDTNAGTLILTGDGALDLENIVNTGNLCIGNNQYISGDIGGTVTVLGTGMLTFDDGTVFTGQLNFDLTGYDIDEHRPKEEGGDWQYLVYLGDSDLSQIQGAKIVNYGELDEEGLYPLANGSRETLQHFADALNESSPTLDHDYLFMVDEDGQLTVQVLDYGYVTMGDVYTWGGTSDQKFDGGTFLPTRYIHSELDHIVMVPDEDVHGWDTAEGTMEYSVQDLFGQDNPTASLRFAKEYGNGQHTMLLDRPASIGAFLVEEGAEGYTIVQKGGQTLRLGTTDPDAHISLSIIKEDFSISTGNTIMQGVHDLHVAEGKTFRIDNKLSVTGTVDVNAVLDAAFLDEALAADNELYCKSTGKFITGHIGMSNGAEFTLHGGTMQASTIILHDTADEDGTETFTVKSGILTVTGRNNGNDSAAIMLGQQANSGKSVFNVEGGVVNVFPGRVILSYQSSGELNLTGGELNAHTLDFGYKDSGASVTMRPGARLNIGAGGIVNATGQDTFTVTGGTLGTLAAGNWTGNCNISLNVAAGDVFTIDTQKHDPRVDGTALATQTGGAITLTGALSGQGDLDKIGKGTLTLSGDNTAKGLVRVKEGELQIKNGGADGWTNINVESGAVLTLAAGATKTDISNVQNNGTLRIGNDTDIAAGQKMYGTGALVVLGGGSLTTHSVDALANASRVTVNVDGTLDLSNGFTQTSSQLLIQNYGDLILGGDVKLRSNTATKINNTGVITVNQDVRFNMDLWDGITGAPASSLTKTFTLFTGMGSINGNTALGADNFYVDGRALTTFDGIRSVSLDDKGVLTVRYWGTQTTASYGRDTTLDELVLDYGRPETVSVSKGATVTVGKLTTSAAMADSAPADFEYKYALAKQGEGTLKVLSVPTDSIESLAVIKGSIILGAAQEGGDEGTRVVFDIGSSRVAGTGGSLENVAFDSTEHIITNISKSKSAVLRDIELRLGNIINNDSSLTNVRFEGNSALSGFVTIDSDTGRGADISVADGATLTIGTQSSTKLAFNFMPGTISDEGADGSTHEWDHTLINLGTGATLTNWDNDHVVFYYDGIMTKGIISIGDEGVAHIDTTKAPELLWNGTAAAWNPTDTVSQGWYEGEKTGVIDHVHVHDWKGYEQTSRFYALSNVHFNTLDSGLNSDVVLGQDLTVFNLTIGGKLEDSAYGDVNGNGIIDGLEMDHIDENGMLGGDPRQTIYNQTAYTFSSGDITVLRDMYVRTAADVTFAGTMGITAQNVRLYNAGEDARVTMSGKLTAENLTIGHRSVLSDNRGY